VMASFERWRLAARAALIAAGKVVNGPSVPLRFGRSKRPVHPSFPFVATKKVAART